jgi:hypothetical protein
MNDENLSSDDLSPPRAESISEAKETQINRMAGCSRLGRRLLILALLTIGCYYLYQYFGTAKNRAKMMCKVTMHDVKIAVENFRKEYNRLPLPEIPGAADIDVRNETRGFWLEALQGKDDTLNPRKIKFLDLKEAKDGKYGLTKKSDERVLVDVWGNPYVVIFDTDNDGRIANPEAKPGETSLLVPQNLKEEIILYSAGPDGNLETWEDNIRSWK